MSNLTRRDASATSGGELTTGAQTIAGAKTFSGATTLSGGLVGKTDGVAVAAGYVGQVLTASLSNVALTVSGTVYNAGSLALTAGTWLVRAKIVFGGAGITQTQCRVSLSTTSAILDTQSFIDDLSVGITSARTVKADRYLTTTGTTIYATASCAFTGTAPATDASNSYIEAIRIA